MSKEDIKYRDLFFEETDEYLDILNSNILKLEENPDDDILLDEVFRAAHTLKGMSASMGYKAMADLTHSLENVFELFRQSKIDIETENINLIFYCIDILSSIVEDLREGNDGDIDIEDALSKLDSLVEAGSNTGGLDEKKIKTDKKIEKKKGNYSLKVRVSKESQLKGARAFLFIKKLNEHGEVLGSLPDEEELKNGEYDFVFELDYKSDLKSEEILDIGYKVSEIEEISIEKKNVKKEKDIRLERDIENISKKKEESIRLSNSELDELMNYISEIVIHRVSMEDIADRNDYHKVLEPLMYLSRATSNLQRFVLDIRMQPVSLVFNRFPRMMRDLSISLGKDIDFLIEGGETKLDRTIVSRLSQPLVHILRNAVDHGIEDKNERIEKGKNPKGKIILKAKHLGDRVIITVEDDGRGIDFEKLEKSANKKGIETDNMSDKEIRNLIFGQGLTTNEDVTDISGRGVGMNVVFTGINELGGSVSLDSEIGKGTSFVIELPLSLLIIPGLIFRLDRETYVVPLESIDRIVESDMCSIKTIDEKEYCESNSELIKIFDLYGKLGLTSRKDSDYLIVLTIDNKKYGFFVDSLLGDKDVVIKKLGPILNRTKDYVGATILANGEVALILDILNMIKIEEDEKTRANS